MDLSSVNRSGRLYRLRYQLGGCLLLAAIAPYLLRVATLTDPALSAPLYQSLLGCVAAICFSAWLLRSITTYPGVEKSAYVLPAFTLSFTLLLLVLLVTRLEYNRTLLLASYAISVGWYLTILSRLARQARLKIGVLPFGDSARLRAIDGVDWVTVDDPAAPTAGLDAVTVDLRTDIPGAWDRQLADYALAGMPVYHTKHLSESLTGRIELEHLSENSFGSLAPGSAFMTVKMLVDRVVAVVAGIVLLVPLLGVGLAVRLTSPGPALFRQRRVGYKGELFTVYKFRTMTDAPAAKDARAAAMTQADDARVTRLGRVLRTTRLDELPQIINVLRGEMSWIGPRPEAEVLSRWYEAELPFYRYRHIVRPGITGWAQVSQGHVSELGEVRSKLHYDFYYIKHYSTWIDLLIIVRTIHTMLTGFGSR